MRAAVVVPFFVAAGLLTALVPRQDARPADRVEALLARMTLDEKLSMLHGAPDPQGLAGAGYLPGVPRLGIPPLRLSDGPAGVRTKERATALPAPVMLASTFDPSLARQYGQVMGRELRARGQDVLLAPMANIVRVPYGGRNFETLGEDPFLASRVVEAEVRGIQGEGAIATIKHYAENNQEDQRTTVDVRVDERTLHEIELQPFEAAVRAGAGAVMAAYNKVNGTYSAENRVLLTDVLRTEWGFPGFVMSDWFATHSGAPALLAGLDLEMPNDAQFRNLPQAVASGQVPVSAVDAAVRRILRQMERVGLLSGATPARPPLDADGDARVAREVAIAGAVLLRNERQTLPLTSGDLAALAVIGPTARVPLVGGGGSARVEPLRKESLVDVLQRLPGVHVAFETGIDLDGVTIPAAALGMQAPIDETGTRALPPGSTRTWTGTLTIPSAGDYQFKLQSDRGQATLDIDGNLLIQPRRPGLTFDVTLGDFGGVFRPSLIDTLDGLQNASVTRRLDAGRHTLTVTATAAANAPQQIRLAWVTPDLRRQRIDAAVAAARRARAVLVVAYNEGTEGHDRASLALPFDQDALVAAVGAANPKTVVVLNAGDPVTMPWVDRVAAILQTWYPGQEGAAATVALLTGEANPGGRLPVTFPRQEADTPVHDPTRYPGVSGREQYAEGVMVGYRWYDGRKIAPLFPFGHGLSYTTFAYSGLGVRQHGDGYDVTFTVQNTGRRPGSEVAQVYVGAPEHPPVAMPPQALAGFARLSLAPGERRTVTITVDARALSYWSDATHAWVRVAARPVFVGSSSRDIRLRGVL